MEDGWETRRTIDIDWLNKLQARNLTKDKTLSIHFDVQAAARHLQLERMRVSRGKSPHSASASNANHSNHDFTAAIQNVVHFCPRHPERLVKPPSWMARDPQS